MEQLSIFAEAGQSPGLPTELLAYQPGLFDEKECNMLLQKFIAGTPWQQKVVKMYDKQVLTPRLTAWYANEETYDYTSLRKSAPLNWTPELLMIKQRVEAIAGVTFNSVLLNYYRDGNDSVAWHSDNEKALGTHPVIGSVSFGQVRTFEIRNKQDHSDKYSIRLESGALMVMKGNLQTDWEHRVPKSKKPMRARVNLTFRIVNNFF
ncbi:alkylated DNA repair dioxygenase AlkB [Pedobacter cryoconitis]|uniref:Alkylated DNA repair dioxygenase AlkB n=1 Tax=Pedobacter cryoconitis TaxID=188932 RepID=A0A7W9E0Q4_9SPHI|nr:alpha-ketoglutarate-dependent dioxygenase AlkB [Pedobacter cryoconitis]MBB5636850.1 alkylated DNA repair dioxygenase AlkB [Pedobacter cryoconitis]MBB6271246.1 alkylated DNA repair dioxygenase AlkB [Pedobacter cryoconitis]